MATGLPAWVSFPDQNVGIGDACCGALAKEGVISYSRGLIKVMDRAALEALSCECYGVVKKETELLLSYLPQRQVISNADSIPTGALPTAILPAAEQATV